MARKIEQKREVGELSDFLRIIAETKNGRLAIFLSEKLSEVAEGVRTAKKKGSLTVAINLTPVGIDPDTTDIKDVEMEVKVTSKVPEVAPGKAVLFFDRHGRLTRHDPDMGSRFDQDEDEEGK